MKRYTRRCLQFRRAESKVHQGLKRNTKQNCMDVLKRYAYYQQVKKYVVPEVTKKALTVAFKALKMRSIKKKGERDIRKKFKRNFFKEAFKGWASHTTRKLDHRQKLRSFQEQRAQRTKQLVFKILICPEFYMSKDPIHFEDYEYFRVTFVFKSWRKFTQRQALLSQKGR